MKTKIVSVVLAVLLIGLVVLPGCASTELDECKALVAEQAAIIEKQADQIASFNSTIEAKDAEIAELKERLGEAEIAKEIAKIEITCIPNPVPCENERWYWRVILKEINGIGVKLQSITEYPYVGERLGNIRTYDHSLIEGKLFNTDYLPAYGILDFRAGLPCQELTHIVYVVRGIDDQGHKITAEGRVDFER